MSSILNQLITVTVLSSVLICAVMLIKRVFKNKLSPLVLSLLWIVVLFRLITPFVVESPVNVGGLINSDAPLHEGSISNTGMDEYNYENYTNNLEDNYTPTTLEQDMFSPTQVNGEIGEDSLSLLTKIKNFISSIEINNLLITVWLTVGIVVILYNVINLWIFSRRINSSHIKDGELLKAFDDAKKAAGVKMNVGLIESENTDIPITYGLLFPKIVLPSVMIKSVSHKKLKLILIHELVHIKHMDILKSYLWLIGKAIHWFNPLVYLAYKLYAGDAEVVCDYKTAKVLSRRERVIYTKSLLEAAKFIQSSNKNNVSIMLSFCEEDTKLRRRIMNILEPIKNSRRQIMFIALAIALLIVGCFTTACTEERSMDTADETAATIEPENTDTSEEIENFEDIENDNPEDAQVIVSIDEDGNKVYINSKSPGTKPEKYRGYIMTGTVLGGFTDVSVLDVNVLVNTIVEPSVAFYPILDVETKKIDIDTVVKMAKTIAGNDFYEADLIKSDYDWLISNLEKQKGEQTIEDYEELLNELAEAKNNANEVNIEADAKYNKNAEVEYINLKAYKDDAIYMINAMYEEGEYSHFHLFNLEYSYEPIGLVNGEYNIEIYDGYYAAVNFVQNVSDDLHIQEYFLGKALPRYTAFSSAEDIKGKEDCYIYRFAPLKYDCLNYFPGKAAVSVDEQFERLLSSQYHPENPLTSEYMDVVVKDNQIVEVIWNGHCEITDHTDYTDIISIDEAFKTFTDDIYMSRIWDVEPIRYFDVNIDSIVLGWVRQDDKMIPAYSFVGTQESTLNGTHEVNYGRTDRACFMIINAIDGTKIIYD